MKLAEVVGSVISDIKTDWLEDPVFRLVQPIDGNGKRIGGTLIALDLLGVSLNEIVFITQGSSCRQTDVTKDKPVDILICGIVDNIEFKDKYSYQKDIGFKS